MVDPAVEKARKQFEEAKARLQAVEARARTAERKRDTRRKIILGGALLDLATRDRGAAKMIEQIISALPRDGDRNSFEGWKPPTPESSLNHASSKAEAT